MTLNTLSISLKDYNKQLSVFIPLLPVEDHSKSTLSIMAAKGTLLTPTMSWDANNCLQAFWLKGQKVCDAGQYI